MLDVLTTANNPTIFHLIPIEVVGWPPGGVLKQRNHDLAMSRVFPKAPLC